MPFSFRHYDFKLMREMVGFTTFVFIGIVVDNLNWSIDRLLLAWIHGTTAVTDYSTLPEGIWSGDVSVQFDATWTS